MRSNTRSNRDCKQLKSDNLFSSTADKLDCVCGEITLSLSDDETSNQTSNTNFFDTYDTDINCHIKSFLSNLPVQIDLHQLQKLTLTNPTEALAVLTEVRKEVETQLHKAQMLRQLYLQQL